MLRVIFLLLDAIDRFLSFFCSVPARPTGRLVQEVSTNPTIYRSSEVQRDASLIISPHPSMYHMLAKACDQYAEQNAIGFRETVEVTTTTVVTDGIKREQQVSHMGAEQMITYRGVREYVNNIGSGLARLGISAQTNIAICENTRWEWLLTCHGAWQQNLTVVTVYSNLGDEGLEYALAQTDSEVIFTDSGRVPHVLKLKLPKLKSIVFYGAGSADPAVAAAAKARGIELVGFQNLIASGKDAPRAPVAPRAEDVGMIMYTSGTTGTPKGVVLTQGALVNALYAIVSRVQRVAVPGQQQAYIAYLPLAHILELLAENVMLSHGFLIGYGSPRTLVSAMPCSDLQCWKPTLLAGVPRVFDGIKKEATSKVDAGPKVTKALFKFAFERRLDAIAANRRTPLWDALVFRRFKGIVGGRLLQIISGGAPLNAETQRFLQACFGCAVGQGYGLTETCAALSLQDSTDISTEDAGSLLQTVEVRLDDVPSMGYTTKTTPPRGEICVRGSSLSSGYYRKPDETAEAFVDKWFHTGDIGEITPAGTIKLIARKKALVKLSMGEYVALERCESVMGGSVFVQPNGICVVAVPTERFVIALVLIQKKEIIKLATEKLGRTGVTADSLPALCKDKDVVKEVLADLCAVGKKAGLKPFELPQRVALLLDEWTPENNVMTAAMKIKRSVVETQYCDVINSLYGGQVLKPHPVAAGAGGGAAH